jgi:hypothetical protein
MDWFWNWGGECFGYRDGDSVFTYFGKEVGRFDGEEIYGSNGRYLGEVMSDNRLITSRSKKSSAHMPAMPITLATRCTRGMRIFRLRTLSEKRESWMHSSRSLARFSG